MKSAKLQDVGWLVLRLGVAAVMMYHGSQKLFGLFDGPGLTATLDGFQKGMGIPPWLGMLAVIAEFAGGLGVAVGLLTRLAAFGIACTMGVAVWSGWREDGSWGKTELPFILLMAAIALICTGAGALSADAMLGKKRK